MRVFLAVLVEGGEHGRLDGEILDVRPPPRAVAREGRQIIWRDGGGSQVLEVASRRTRFGAPRRTWVVNP